MNKPVNPTWLRPEDVAAQIGLSPVYVRIHSRRNNPKSPVIKSTIIGGRYRYQQSDVDDFISQNAKKAS